MSDDPTVAAIQAAAEIDGATFAAKMAESSLEAAVDIWLRRVAHRRLTTMQRTRLVKAVERGSSPETRVVQLTRAALMRAAGLDDRPAVAAATAAGATDGEVGAVLGISKQAVSYRMRGYRGTTPVGDTP
ncbi:Fis family transcriptional regulator [Mycobacterium intracellulare]|uniref:Fis family transcriptional regulator n=1 Tax=Mycobacterium intracellulare TaxID=1767 RepID=UPI001EEDADEC|nr:Fis family transcriptional regulator [Mycobacterium intracellulare]MEE3755226.1 Fis family transcriptional regulator [Mycobacterium intracellulare]